VHVLAVLLPIRRRKPRIGLPLEAPMPFSIRPSRCFPVQFAVMYNVRPFHER